MLCHQTRIHYPAEFIESYFLGKRKIGKKEQNWKYSTVLASAHSSSIPIARMHVYFINGDIHFPKRPVSAWVWCDRPAVVYGHFLSTPFWFMIIVFCNIHLTLYYFRIASVIYVSYHSLYFYLLTLHLFFLAEMTSLLKKCIYIALVLVFLWDFTKLERETDEIEKQSLSSH